MTASAFGAALIGLATHLPVWALLLLIASSPLLAGALGTLLLTLQPQPPATATNPASEPAARA